MTWYLVKVVGLLLLGVALYLAYAVGMRRFKARKKDPRKLWKRLVGLTHDSDVAERLVSNAKERFPHLSEAAILKRVIKRLERDRGR